MGDEIRVEVSSSSQLGISASRGQVHEGVARYPAGSASPRQYGMQRRARSCGQIWLLMVDCAVASKPASIIWRVLRMVCAGNS